VSVAREMWDEWNRREARSIESIVSEPWFNEKPWLICGTGESLERFRPELRDQFNIWCIYYSLDLTGWADVLHFQDVHQEGNYRDVSKGFPTEYRYCLIRHPEALQAMYPHLQSFVPPRSLIVSYSGDLEYGGTAPGEIFPTSNSTSFAFLFLCKYSKFKAIHTLGIDDGSSGIAKGVNELYTKITMDYLKEHPGSWGLENASNQGWCDSAGVKWVRL